MKKSTSIIRLAILLCSIIVLPEIIQAQISVQPIKSAKGDDTQGFYYALPRHVIKADLIVRKTQRIKGPYSEYAERVLGVSDYVKQDEIVYALEDAILSTEVEADPEAWYLVEFDDRGSKDARSLVFELQNNGTILAIDDSPTAYAAKQERIEKTIVNTGAEQHFKYYAERNVYQRIDTIVRNITIDTAVIKRNVLQTAWVDRTPEQKARAAADFIQQIREDRFNLLIGYQEVNFGQSIGYMDQQLQKLEQEYLSLFLGAEVHSLVEQTVYFYPKPDAKGIQNIARFSESVGVVTDGMKGENLQLIIDPVDMTGKLKDGSKNSGKSKISNGIYYRVPDAANLSLMYKGQLLTSIRASISQFGFIGVIPLHKTRIQFDPNSGTVTTIKRE